MPVPKITETEAEKGKKNNSPADDKVEEVKTDPTEKVEEKPHEKVEKVEEKKEEKKVSKKKNTKALMLLRSKKFKHIVVGNQTISMTPKALKALIKAYS